MYSTNTQIIKSIQSYVFSKILNECTENIFENLRNNNNNCSLTNKKKLFFLMFLLVLRDYIEIV